MHLTKFIRNFSLGVMMLCSSQAFAQKDTIKVLAIGNGYSAEICSADLYGYFKAAGQSVVIGYVTKLSADFEEHAALARSGEAAYNYSKITGGVTRSIPSASLAQALGDEKWDVVTLQQQSFKAAHRETIDPWLGQLVKYVRKCTPKGVRIMYLQTWPYARQSTRHWMNFGHNNVDMYPLLASVSQEFTQKYKLEVIPIGTAIQSLRSSFNREADVTYGDHLNCTIGMYTAAATIFEAVTGRDAREVTDAYAPYTLPNHVRREMAAKCAHYSCLQPFEMTSMRSGSGAYGSAEGILPNYDESKVPPYTLPDPLKMNDGTPVCGVEQWEGKRRAEILDLFRREVYGYSAPRQDGQHYKLLYSDDNAFGGLATREEILVYFDASEDKYLRLLAYYPNDVKGPVPAFLFMNTAGNVSVCEDEGISYPDRHQVIGYEVHGYPARGQFRHFYPVEMIIKRGYAFLTFYKGDLDPDFDDGYKNGVHPYIYEEGQDFPYEDQWGAISAWAWGYSRVMDWLEEGQSRVDSHKVATIGHSRGGKTALWAAAQDQRFAMAVSNCSGCGGTALHMRKYGQTIRQITITFPNWFCANYLKYMDAEETMPVDQHELVALIAPRPVYVGTADGDQWADPRGEFLSLVHATPVYQLYGIDGMPTDEFPALRQPIYGDRLGFHVRVGKHSITPYDWDKYMDFADKYLK